MKILYVDDEKETLDTFTSDHASDGISIETCLDARRIVEMLGRRKPRERPDLIVMDLYATNADFNSEGAKETNRKVEFFVEKICEARAELQDLVKQSKSPAGIYALRQLKASEELKSIPVILRTREGLALLGDDILKESIELGAQWMLKGRAPVIERAMFYRTLDENRSVRKRLKRDVVIMVIGSLLGAALSALTAL